MNLYWVTTEDHDEDWFIIAPSLKAAAIIHEQNEGYNPGDAKAKKVLNIPDHLDAEPGWPSKELLLALGARYISHDEPRVVEIAGQRYCEGILQAFITELCDDYFELRGDERLNKTNKSTRH